MAQETSKEAYESITGDLPRMRAAILMEVRKCGDQGATDDELEVALELLHQTASARRRELVQLGLIYDSGYRRRTRSGRRAIVWMAVEPGAFTGRELPPAQQHLPWE